MAKECTDCGSSLADDATFCEQCGGTVRADEPPPPAQPAPPAPAPQGPSAQQPSEWPETVDRPVQTDGGSRVSTARPTTLDAGRATTFKLSQLPLLNSRKRLIIAAVVVVVLVAAVLGSQVVVQRTVYTPEQAVTGFFESLQNRDVKAANSYLNFNDATTLFWSAPTATLATAKVLRSNEYKPPTNVRIIGVGKSDDGDKAAVRVGYDVTGEHFVSELSLTLSDDERQGLFFRKWLIDSHHEGGVMGEIYIKANYPRIEVNGLGISAKENLGSRNGMPEPSVRMDAFPGGYRATIPDNPLLAATPQFVGTVANDEFVGVEIPLALKKSGMAEIRRQVKQRIDNCVKDTQLVPKDGEQYCPFRSTGSVGGPDNNQRDIKWSVKRYPTVEITHDPTFLASGVQVRAKWYGDEAGIVDLSYTADDPFETKPKKVTTEVIFGIDDTAEVVKGNVVYDG